MLKQRMGLIAIGFFSVSQVAMANGQEQSKGFIEDGDSNIIIRNSYIGRDYKNGKQDKVTWGQSFTSKYESGFTQGTVGVGVDITGQYAIRLNSGTGSSGEAAYDLARGSVAAKARISGTIIKYGQQIPNVPVLQYDNSRLLSEIYEGTSIVSKEIAGLQLDASHLTKKEACRGARGSDSGRAETYLKNIDYIGGSYKFTEGLSAALYVSNMQDMLKKQYINVKYMLALPKKQSLTFNFNGYNTKLDRSFAIEKHGNADARDNKIWSLSATWAIGPHSFTVVHQRSNGDIGSIGDAPLLANSYWSDFNSKDERSWQAGYGLNFSVFGMPELTYSVAYVHGSNIDDGSNRGNGTELEIFNQFRYVIRNGPAKDITLRARASWLRVSSNVSNYNVSGNEIRLFADYPINLF
ncbi:OprD family outer membrane porin [Candidatus Pseudomonas adelgestsugas]|uniref:Porin D n=1 Tax=Candidatus Pseudomonas adelgestsugas TaxID=1302376 RepID=A0ABX5R796_9PSED|nr:OprD family outer membrane porin [Candidatus Pseudomonas adelgestsugas]QAX81521.1 Porin D precursor [Candidatus Pseudomonas adelgestsugas]